MSAFVLGAVCALAASCGGGGDTRTSFSTWDDFVDNGRRPRSPQVVVVGIDAGSWDFMDGLIERGELPNIARVCDEGVKATLRSIQTYVSPPAWTTMLTGYQPEKSGVYTFGSIDWDAGVFNSSYSTDALVPFVWETASRAGLRCGVINVPMTFPVYPVNGVMVSGLLTPVESGARLAPRPGTATPQLLERADAAAAALLAGDPPAAHAVLEDDLYTYVAVLHASGTGASLHVFPREGGDVQSMALVAGEYSPWFRLQVREGETVRDAWVRAQIDRAPAGGPRVLFSERVYPIEAQYTWPDTLARELDRRFGFYLPTKGMEADVLSANAHDTAEHGLFFYDYDDWDLFCFVFTESDNVHHKAGFSPTAEAVYREIDRFVGELMARLPDDAVLIIASDHGARAYDNAVDLNRLFEQMNLLSRDGQDVDFDKSLVIHNLWHIYLNHDRITREELAARGYPVPAGQDPETFLEDLIIEACRDIHVRTRAFPVEVMRIPADAAGHAPDMTVKAGYDDYMVQHWNVEKPSYKVVRPLGGSDRNFHSRDGILAMWGAGVRRGLDGGVTGIENVGPTISYCLGVPLGTDMDGRVLTEYLTDAMVADRPGLTVDAYRDIPRAGFPATVDREDLREKLRSLGYVQ